MHRDLYSRKSYFKLTVKPIDFAIAGAGVTPLLCLMHILNIFDNNVEFIHRLSVFFRLR
jgi:hypothetical protein